MLNLAMAAYAIDRDWPQAYSSPDDMANPLPTGTIEECWDNEGDPVWYRVWCTDQTARRVPTEAAYVEGLAARQKGLCLGCNPFTEDLQPMRQEWERGWLSRPGDQFPIDNTPNDFWHSKWD